MADFNKYEKRLQDWEGSGYSNKASDKGGPTNSGITIDTFRMFYGQDKTIEDLKNMTYEQWRRIMKGGFWDKCKADQINNQSVAEIFVDWTINSGWGMIKKVQKIVGVAEDGIVGPKTIMAINSCNQRALHYRIKKARALWYLGCVDGGIDLNPRATILPTNIANIDGWMRRLGNFLYAK